MIAAGEHVQLLEHASAERVLRQHALHRKLDRALGMLVQKLLERDRLDAADMARVVVVDLVRQLAPGDADLLRIHHDDVITHVDVRAVIGLVLALQAMGDLRGQAAERLVAGVDDEPIAADGGGLGEYGLHRSLAATARWQEGRPLMPGPKKAGKCTQAGAAMQSDPSKASRLPVVPR